MGLGDRYHDVVQRAARRSFAFWERRGLHVTPVHYYQPLPDSRLISADLWPGPTAVPGIDLAENLQVALVSELAAFREEYATLPTSSDDPTRFHLHNGFFGPVDAEVHYATLRMLKPSRVIEVGSGFSTLLALEALRRNHSEGSPEPRLIAVEPYPNDVLARGLDGLELLRTPVQDVPVELFEELTAGDVLFLDSSHVLRIGGDVQFEYLEILPRLAPGVFVHVHDIFLPYEYPRQWVERARQFWTEQYLLQAFLAFNDCFQIRWSSHLMHRRHPELLQSAFPSFRPDLDVPSSFWMVRTGHSMPN